MLFIFPSSEPLGIPNSLEFLKDIFLLLIV